MAVIKTFPYIPSYITVHLGRPDSSAQNVTVAFIDYIKNVASSEIYPTWGESAIRANIYAQISFALNRIFLEYYPSRGYNFNITSSTAFDQSFQNGRNIFDNISRIVDSVFNDYIRRAGFVEPLAAKYCNGTTVTCEGLSQWGSEELARQGYTPFGILQYYYGYNIELVFDAPVSDLRESYPGVQRRGSTGPNVEIIQQSLNRISQFYPAIPKIYPVDSVFGEQTENAVKKFQSIFNLTPDGVVGKATWYKLVFLFVGIRRLAELESDGVSLFGLSLEYPDAISEGNRGEKVYILQYFLSILAEFYTDIPFVEITGVFGPETKNAVLALQKQAGLPETGVVDDTTWNDIYRPYIGAVDTVFLLNQRRALPARPYPGTVLALGSKGPDVEALQQYLNLISLTFTEISPVPVTGIYEQKTMRSVMQYQARFHLPRTGEVNRAVWNSITDTYRSLLSATTTSPLQYPGQVLRLGSRDANT